MSFPKVLTVGLIALFGVIGLVAVFKRPRASSEINGMQEIAFEVTAPPVVEEKPSIEMAAAIIDERVDVDRMSEFFNTRGPKFPIVETVTYTSRVPWNQGRPAWVEAYAAHYGTSRHFIARSLNGKSEYDNQKVANGDKFNVFKVDRPVSFHLVVDIGRSRLWAYYYDESTDERVLVKSCTVGLGRYDENCSSGSLTPLGTYSLGEKIAVYRRGASGLYNGRRTEMMQVFGTRWIPFEKEISDCTASSKGLGIHGCPWTTNENGELVEDRSGLGSYTSDGCIRLATADMEELFSVIITKPATVYLVEDMSQAKLPGHEV